MAAETKRTLQKKEVEAANRRRKKKEKEGRVVSRVFQAQAGPTTTNQPDQGSVNGGRAERREKRKRSRKKERVVSRFFQPEVEGRCSLSGDSGDPIVNCGRGIAKIEEPVVPEKRVAVENCRAEERVWSRFFDDGRPGVDSRVAVQVGAGIPDIGDSRVERRREKRSRKKERVVSSFFQHQQPELGPELVQCSEGGDSGDLIVDFCRGKAIIEEPEVPSMMEKSAKEEGRVHRRFFNDGHTKVDLKLAVPDEKSHSKEERVCSRFFHNGHSRVDSKLAAISSREIPNIDELFSQFIYCKKSVSDPSQSRERMLSPCSHNRGLKKSENIGPSTRNRTYVEAEVDVEAEAKAEGPVKAHKIGTFTKNVTDVKCENFRPLIHRKTNAQVEAEGPVKAKRKRNVGDVKCENIRPLILQQANTEAVVEAPLKAKKKKNVTDVKCDNDRPLIRKQTNAEAEADAPVKAKKKKNIREVKCESTVPLTQKLSNAEEEAEAEAEAEAPVKAEKNVRTSSTILKAEEKRKEAYRRKDADNTWKPPCSIHRLLQEDHAYDPWRVLVICMLLNCTTGKQTGQILETLFSKFPNAKAAAEAPSERIEEIIKTLGLQKKRSCMIKRMSQEYLDDSWTHVTQLHGVGKYAADAYAIFCTGRWYEVSPVDHKLKDYWDYLWTIEDKLRSPHQVVSFPHPMINDRCRT